MAPAKAYWIRNGLSIDAHGDDSCIGQTHFNVLVACLGGNAILGILQQFLLRPGDKRFQFLRCDRFRRLLPLLIDGYRTTLHQLSRNADHG